MSIDTKNVVFIPGAFVTHHCWEPWMEYFAGKGYKCINPPWPFKNGTVAELRAKHPDGNPGLAALTLAELIDHYADIIKGFPEKPIVIGHSLGGLTAQVLVNRDLIAAGVAIHPVPTLGVFPYEFSFLRAGWRSLGIFSSTKRTYMMSFGKWQYAFVNEMPLADQQKAYDETTIPESKKAVRGGLTKAAAVDYAKPHPPLLITSGDKDNIIPASLNERNFKAYKESGSVLDYKEFPGRNHFVVGQPTWKEDADYILEWIARQ